MKVDLSLKELEDLTRVVRFLDETASDDAYDALFIKLDNARASAVVKERGISLMRASQTPGQTD